MHTHTRQDKDMPGDDWSRDEVEATVADYFAMLRDELAGLRVLNPSTSPGPNVFDVANLVEEPPEAMQIPQNVWSSTARLGRVDFVARDAANRDLGRRGEEFALEFERKRLHDGGRRDLLPRIEWTSNDKGDGAGYDIRSFDADGTERLIEVKTTGLGKYFPFNVTANELRCSQARSERFHLYRVFRFGSDAKLYILRGELTKSCHLDPTYFRAYVHGHTRTGS